MKKEEIQEIVEELDSSHKKLVFLIMGWKKRYQRGELTKEEKGEGHAVIWDIEEARDALKDATNSLENAVKLLEEK